MIPKTFELVGRKWTVKRIESTALLLHQYEKTKKGEVEV